jgi:ADP-ribosylglycohydrolase
MVEKCIQKFRKPGQVRLTWPSALSAPPSKATLSDLYRGSLLWGAVGNALGRPVEGKDPQTVRTYYKATALGNYVKWHGWKGGPIGTITDDTQLTIEVARSLIATDGDFDPADFVVRLIAWLPIGRGKGRSTVEAIDGLIRGVAWHDLGGRLDSAGNGAAMRAAPVGLVRALAAEPDSLVRDAILSALPTHAHPVGVAGAVAIAAGVAWCIRERLAGSTHLDSRAFLDFVSQAVDRIEKEPTLERKPGGKPVFLRDRIREIADLLTWPDPAAAFAYTYNGAFALESVPAAIYCFLRAPGDSRQVLLIAVNAGRDADSVASMAGNLVGAWSGAEGLQHQEKSWWDELEYREELIQLADGLADIALRHL